MNRRATLAKLMGKQTAAPARVTAPPPPPSSGLEPFTGPYTKFEAAHLLRRTLFGPTKAEILSSVDAGLEATLGELLMERPLPSPPVNYDDPNNAEVPLGETWVDAPYSSNEDLLARNRSLAAWTIGRLMAGEISVREKMTLFWINHFAISNVNDPKYYYRYASTLRGNALGNFRDLVKAITIDPAMLRFLNGNQNTAQSPNENYARELFELFSIGKGPQIGPGDYTYYTEQDILEVSRILTGWRDVGYRSPRVGEISVEFRPFRHDQGTKQLSDKFDNAIIQNMGADEFAHLIDIIFQNPATARHICRKLYRWFVYYIIDEQVEANVIEPMAQIMVDNDYAIRPALEALLRSNHFFDQLSVGPMIKNPLDFIVSAFRPLHIGVPGNYQIQYGVWSRIYSLAHEQQMNYYQVPEVAGWKAYYQGPLYYRTWINSSTLPVRMNFTDVLVTSGFRLGEQLRIEFKPLEFLETMDDPADPNALIAEFAETLMPQPLTEGQISALKEILIPGLPDFEWTVEYQQYLTNPDDLELAESVANRVKGLVRAMLNLPEFYLS